MSFQQAPCRAETGNSVKALLNRKQTAKAINVSLRTIDEWREKGIIPFLKIRGVVRFDIDEVMAVLRERYEVRRQEREKALKVRAGRL